MQHLFTLSLLLVVQLLMAGPIQKADITELDDFDYPDNPDLLTRSAYKGEFSHEQVLFDRKDDEHFTVTISPNNNKSDKIILENIKLIEWIPTIPEHIKEDDYIEKICIINQEWNRQQVRFKEGTFKIEGNNLEKKLTTRVDFARNCLNSYLWEIITYTTEGDRYKPIYHGWFNFPKGLYLDLYKQKNDQSFNQYANHLEDWIDIENEVFRLDVLRSVKNQISIDFEEKNDQFYAMAGERKKKAMNIVYPENYTKIKDFLNDSTMFATFSIPGFYNKEDPRPTQLGRFYNINNVLLRETDSNVKDLEEVTYELEFKFSDIQQERKTRVILGGLDFKKFPTLAIKNVNSGYMMPMGIANHSFYEDYDVAINNSTYKNPYFGVILDNNNVFYDSHKVGIDGPLFHFDIDNPDKLHVWFLSFERHSLVGHYEIMIPKELRK